MRLPALAHNNGEPELSLEIIVFFTFWIYYSFLPRLIFLAIVGIPKLMCILGVGASLSDNWIGSRDVQNKYIRVV